MQCSCGEGRRKRDREREFRALSCEFFDTARIAYPDIFERRYMYICSWEDSRAYKHSILFFELLFFIIVYPYPYILLLDRMMVTTVEVTSFYAIAFSYGLHPFRPLHLHIAAYLEIPDTPNVSLSLSVPLSLRSLVVSLNLSEGCKFAKQSSVRVLELM